MLDDSSNKYLQQFIINSPGLFLMYYFVTKIFILITSGYQIKLCISKWPLNKFTGTCLPKVLGFKYTCWYGAIGSAVYLPPAHCPLPKDYCLPLLFTPSMLKQT